MIPNKQRIYKLKLVSVFLNESNLNYNLEFSFKSRNEIFKNDFIKKLDNLHDFYFGKIFIQIKSLNKIIASSRIDFKNINNDIDSNMINNIYKFILTNNSVLNSADYYNKCVPNLGFIEFEIKIEETNLFFVEKSRENINLKIKILNTIFNRYLSDFNARIFNLAFELQHGSLRCKIFAILGFMITHILSTWIYFSCQGHDKDLVCDNSDCFNNYNNISKKISKNALSALHYSVIAYAHFNLPLFGPKKLRNVKHNNKIVKHILDHSNIRENDIIKIDQGSNESIGFIYFFAQNILVITIKGTTSPKELLNALDAEYVNFHDGFVHSGFLRLARRFLEFEWINIIRCIRKRKIKNITLTGHSMGGAVASILYLIMKNEEKYLTKLKNVNIKVYSFSSPPCISKNIALKKHKNIINFSYEHDTVSKLSFGSILDFKYLCMSIDYKFTLKNFLLFRKNLIIKKIEKIRNFLKNSNIHEKLYLPGYVYNIRSVKINKEQHYKFKLLDPDDSVEIRQNMNSFFNHFTCRIGSALESSLNRKY